MAVTSIWSVKGRLANVIEYAKNPDKTDNPEYEEAAVKKQAAAESEKWLNDVIAYATRDSKTREAVHDERAEIMRRFVTGVNCLPETVKDEMLAVKHKFGKTDGVIAYHGYQSFAPTDRVTPEMAHEIGVKLAEKLWGERFQVIVATHLDKANHLHNHFVLNNVSMVDGKKYYRSERDYWLMQRESDALCREYSLSVIEEPKRGKAKHYAEWNAEREGKPTYRSAVKTEIDQAIRESMTERQLWENLHKKGWHIKFGKDITVRPPGKDRGLKLCRNFGEDYAIEGIRRRILAQSRPERIIITADPPPKRARLIGSVHKAKKIRGLRALYFYYLYRMGVLPKRQTPNPKRVYFLFREDIRHLRDMTQEIRLLGKYEISTMDELLSHCDRSGARLEELSGERKRLRNSTRSIKDEDRLAAVQTEIAALSEKIGELRREVRLCEDIESRSVDMKEKLHRARETELSEKSKARELKQDDQFRRRR